MTASDNKFGLCLSGGGFRAALYHIGTLAALAERGQLHQVEVLSTVSGGSIIGAYYYLKVKELLEGKRPGCPTPQPSHYLDIVQEIERDFLAAVQKNIRMRLLLNPLKTAKMLLVEDYSRSDRLADLFNDFFFNDIALTENIRLHDIYVKPQNADQFLDQDGEFDVRKYNETEQCKIPVLTINATCLNTGHPFHFTASWVGEPARSELYKIEQNSNVVLPQLRFDGHCQNDRSKLISEEQRNTLKTIMLSDAVAASAAVPGLFPSLPIRKLYRTGGGEEIVVELADGGVFDNQGLDALLVEQCTHIFVSDACGQLEDERLLPTDILSGGLRANDVMMERIRGYGYFDLDLRNELDAKLPPNDTLRTKICFIENSNFTHLREQAKNTSEMPALPGPVNQPSGVVYRLSNMRTDFDAFSDMEAYTLMYQGYALVQSKLPMTDTTPLRPWHFLEIREEITHDLPRLAKHLKVSKEMLFKSFRLAPAESWVALSFYLAPFLLIAVYWLCINWNIPVIQPQAQIVVASVAANNDTSCSAKVTAPIEKTTCCLGNMRNPIHTVSLPPPTTTWGDIALWMAAGLFSILPLSSTVREWFKVLPILRSIKLHTVLAAWLPAVIFSAVVSVVVFVNLKVFNNIFLKAGKLKIKL